jgi:hypothetical protein
LQQKVDDMEFCAGRPGQRERWRTSIRASFTLGDAITQRWALDNSS